MTQDEIYEMAHQAGVENEFNYDFKLSLETFANLVAAKEQKKWQDQTSVEIHEAAQVERESCAKVAEHSFGVIGSTIALAIRARGEA
jgi:hypothetical protein